MAQSDSDIAKYPFLEEAGSLVRGLTMSYFDTPEGYLMIQMAAKTIMEVEFGKYKLPASISDTTQVKHFMTTAILLKIAAVDKLTKKVSLAFAKKMEQQMINEIRFDRQALEVKDRLIAMLAREFELQVDLREQYDACQQCVNEKRELERHVARKGIALSWPKAHAMKLEDFLTLAEYFKSEEWSLNSRRVHAGYVFLNSLEEAVKLARSLIDKKFRERIANMRLPAKIPKQLLLAAQSLAGHYIQTFSAPAIQTGIPPCVKHCIDILQKGENLPHTGRVFVASYLLSAGKSIEEVVEVFKNAPDFKQSTTRYQVEYLSQKKQSGDSYGVYGCSKLKGYGYCFPDTQCAGIINPLKYGRKS